MMRCPRCGYEWKAKVAEPKECPQCKARLRGGLGKKGAKKGDEEKGKSELRYGPVEG